MSENSNPPYSDPNEEEEENLKKEKKEKEFYPPKPSRPAEPSPSPTASIPIPPPLPKEISPPVSKEPSPPVSKEPSPPVSKEPSPVSEDVTTTYPRPQPTFIPEKPSRAPLPPQPISVEGEEEETKKRSFFWLGCLFFLVWNIALMFLLEATLQPRDSMIAGIIAYSLGLLGLVVFSLLVNNIKKIALTFPVLLIITFGLSVLFHHTNLPAYNPLAPLAERSFFVIESIKSSTNLFGTEEIVFGSIGIETLELWSLAVYAVDFIIIILIFMVGALSIVWFINLVTSSEQKTSKTALAIVALALFTIGLVLSPIIHLSLVGFVDFGGNTLVGANYITGSADIMRNFGDATQEEINIALENFLLAAENIRKARDSIQMFSFVFGLIQITEVLLHFIDASLILLSGIEPMINGSYQIYQGFQDVSEALNQSAIGGSTATQGSIKKSIINESLFQTGVNKVEAALNDLGSSTNLLYDAFDEINLADMSDIYNLLDGLPFQTDVVQLYVADIEEYIQSFSTIPGVIEILVEHPIKDDSPTRYATLTHFLYGAYNLIKAADFIGDNSAYNGTSALFDNARSNFSLVYDQLEKEEAQQMIGSETLFFNETLSFIYDMTKISYNISIFGSDMEDVFTGLNNTISYFDQGYENITNYPEISNELDNLVNISESLNSSAYVLDYDISIMKTKSDNETYGVFSEPSERIVSSLEKFDLITNAENSYNVARALFHLFNSMRYLKDTHVDIVAGEELFVNDSLYVEANNSFIAANVSLYNSMTEMDTAIFYMNKTAAGDMDQLAEARITFIEIKNTLESVIIYFNNLLSLASLGPAANPADVTGNSTIIIDTLSNVNNQLTNITTL